MLCRNEGRARKNGFAAVREVAAEMRSFEESGQSAGKAGGSAGPVRRVNSRQPSVATIRNRAIRMLRPQSRFRQPGKLSSKPAPPHKRLGLPSLKADSVRRSSLASLPWLFAAAFIFLSGLLAWAPVDACLDVRIADSDRWSIGGGPGFNSARLFSGRSRCPVQWYRRRCFFKLSLVCQSCLPPLQ